MAQLSVTAAVASDVGRSRATNEDWAIAKQFITGRQQELGPVWLAAVADGMGGHAAGEVASRVAIAALEGVLEQALRQAERAADLQAALMHAFAAAHAAVQVRAGALSEGGNMGTTLTAAMVVGNRLWIAHVGDSRAYLLRNGGVEQLTEDQAIPPNRLTQALGMGGNEIIPDVFSRDLQEGDAILLTSDGLHTALRPRDLHLAVRTSSDAHTACQKLVGAARLRDGSDNITVACLAVGRAFGRRRRTRRRRLALGGTLTTVLAGITLVGWLMTKPPPPLGAKARNVRLDLRVEDGRGSANLVPGQASGGPCLLVGGQQVERIVPALEGAPAQRVVLVVEAARGGVYRWILGREKGAKGPTWRGRGVTVDKGEPSLGTELQDPALPGCDRMELYTGPIARRPTSVSFNLAGPHGRDVPVVLDFTPQGAAETVALPVTSIPSEPSVQTAPGRREPRRRSIPPVSGLRQAQAEARLQSAGAKRPIRVIRSRASEPNGRAVKTEPPAGRPMPSDGRITLIISDGPPPSKPQPVKVPAVMGVQAEEARSLLKKAGLGCQVREVEHPGPRGTVVGRTPPSPEVLSGTAVTLLVSKGPVKEPTPVTSAVPTMPRVKGSLQAEAEKALQAARLQYVVRKVADQAVPPGSVIGSEPAEGEPIDSETKVVLMVSTGRGGSRLRNVTGWTVAKATKQLKEDGLQPVIAGGASDEDLVTGTEPAAGKVVKPGETVTLSVTPLPSSEGEPQ